MNDLVITPHIEETAVSIGTIGADPLPHFDRLLARHDLARTTAYRYQREIELAQSPGCSCGHRQRQHAADDSCTVKGCQCEAFDYSEPPVDLLDATAVSDYAAGLPSSRKMFLRAAVGLMAREMVQTAKANATPSNVAAMQAVMWRAESLRDSINVKHTAGHRAHTWLNLAEVRTLVNLPKTTDRAGLRDKVLLGLLVGAGLRREEAATLAWSDVVRVDGRAVLNITGKGEKTRPVPISEALVGLLDDWALVVGSDGRVLRNVDQVGRVGDSMTGQAILDVVQRYGRCIGKPELRPHDLRRTYARIGYDAGIDIGQVSKLLGHASIATTQRYLGLEVDTKKTVSDFVPLA